MYPCWRYKKSDIGIISKIIFSIEEEQRLGGEWFDTPSELESAQPVVKKRAKNGNKGS